MKLKHRKTTEGDMFAFWCCGCQETHSYLVSSDPDIKAWKFVNGDMENPTFEPSLRYPKCHLFLREGIIEFLGDCRHRYAGRKMPLEDF